MQAEGGFVNRAVEESRELFDAFEAVVGRERDYVPPLAGRLFGTVLGYDDRAYRAANDWQDVTFEDAAGRPAVLLSATERGDDVEGALTRAFERAADEPTARYVAATNLDRLVVYARCAEGNPRAETREGVTTRPLTDVDLRDAVEGSADTALSEALTPGQQLAIAKLTALQRHEVSDSLADASDVSPGRERSATASDRQSTELADPDGGDGAVETDGVAEADDISETDGVSETDDTDTADSTDTADTRTPPPSQLPATLTRCLDEVLVPAVEAAFDDGRGDDDLELAFETWDDADHDAGDADEFCRESAAALLDAAFLDRVAAERDLGGRLSAGLDDGVFGWAFAADLDGAVDRVENVLAAFDLADRDAADLSGHFEAHLRDDERPVRGATRPATAGLLLDRAGYTAEQFVEEPECGLLDPASGDGSVLVGAAGRLLDRLSRADVSAVETMAAVRDRLVGFDVHPSGVHLTETRLRLRTADAHAEAVAADGSVPFDGFEVYRTDALLKSRQRRLTEDAATHAGQRAAADQKTRSDFGFVVGDVPTAPRTSLPAGEHVEEYDAYRNAHYDYDLSALFLERAADWLAEGGHLSLSAAGGVLSERYGERARAQLAQEFRVRELVDFDTGGRSGTDHPLFVVAERIRTDSPARAPAEYRPPSYQFSYARVTPTFASLVREGLVRPGEAADAKTTPAELVGASLPSHPHLEAPAAEAVLVELDLLRDDAVGGEPPVETDTVDSEALAGTKWTFVGEEPSVSVGGETPAGDAGNPWFRVDTSAQD